MPWTAITAADIEARIPANALAALRERYNLDGTDPLAVLIADTVARIRGAVSSCDDYTLDADTTRIPGELKDDAAWIVAGAIMLRVPEVMTPTEDHRTRIRQAEDRLIQVSKCEFAIGDPGTPATDAVQSTGGVTLVSSSPRRNTREKLSGLL